jgi:hypothetical protein
MQEETLEEKSENNQNTNNITDCITEVNFCPSKVNSVNITIKQARRVCSFRINPELKTRLKQVAKAQGSSECELLEALITGYLVAVENALKKKVYFSHTINNFNLVREVKRARRHLTEPGNGSVETIRGSIDKCHLCNEKPEFVGIHWTIRDKTFERIFLCGQHLELLRSQGGLDSWKPIK